MTATEIIAIAAGLIYGILCLVTVLAHDRRASRLIYTFLFAIWLLFFITFFFLTFFMEVYR